VQPLDTGRRAGRGFAQAHRENRETSPKTIQSRVSPSTALGGNKAKGVSKFSMTNKNSFEGGPHLGCSSREVGFEV